MCPQKVVPGENTGGPGEDGEGGPRGDRVDQAERQPDLCPLLGQIEVAE